MDKLSLVIPGGPNPSGTQTEIIFNPPQGVSGDGSKLLTHSLPALISLIFVVATLLAFLFLIFGGIKWITSGGDKAGVEGARKTILYAIIGLVIVFLSFFIINLITTRFGFTFF